MTNKVIAIIPARFNSTRFPGKPLVMIKDKPMIQHVFDNIKKCDAINDVIVATDNENIYKTVNKFGTAVYTKKDHKNGTERIAEVAKNYNKDDIIINVQGDEPLIKSEALKCIIAAFDDGKIEIATLINHHNNVENINNENIVKVVKDLNDNALFFSRKPLLSSTNEYYSHIGIYAFRNKTLQQLVKLQESNLEKTERLEQLRWLENGYKIKTVLTKYKSISVDVADDINKVLAAMNEI